MNRIKTYVILLLINIVFIINLYSFPEKVGFYNCNRFAKFTVHDQYLYLFDGARLQVVDISDQTNPNQISEIAFTPGYDYYILSLCKYENYVSLLLNHYFQTGSYRELYFFDVSDPYNPQYVSNLRIGGGTQIIIQNNIIFSRLSHSMNLFNFANHGLVSTISFPEYSRGFQIIDNYLYLLTHSNLQIYDISDIYNPTLINTFTNIYGKHMNISENKLYVKGDSFPFSIYDLTEPTQPIFIAQYDFWCGLNSFSVIDNFLYVRSDDLFIFDVSDSNNPIFLSKYEKPNICDINSMCFYEGFEYLNISYPSNYYLPLPEYLGISIIDFSDFSNPPPIISTENIGKRIRTIQKENTNLFIGKFNEIQVYDYTNIYNPELLSIYSFPWGIEILQLELINNILFTLYEDLFDYKFAAFDVSDVENIYELDCYETTDDAYVFSIVDDYVLIGEEDGNIEIVNVSNPSNIQAISNFTLSETIYDFDLNNQFLAVANGDNGFVLLDISNPASPTQIITQDTPGRTVKVTFNNNIAYVADYHEGIQIIDCNDLMNPQIISTVMPNSDSFVYSKPIIIDEKLIFFDCNWNELFIYNISDPSNPAIDDFFKSNIQINDLIFENDAIFAAGNSSIHLIDSGVVSLSNELFHNFDLIQNYPNPFNPTTTIRFDLNKTADVRLDIYNTKGQKVKTLVDQQLETGNHTYNWEGKDARGKQVTSGVYFYKLRAGEFEQVRKMMVLK